MELCVDACCGHNLLRTHEICELVDMVAWYLHSLARSARNAAIKLAIFVVGARFSNLDIFCVCTRESRHCRHLNECICKQNCKSHFSIYFFFITNVIIICEWKLSWQSIELRSEKCWAHWGKIWKSIITLKHHNYHCSAVWQFVEEEQARTDSLAIN